MKNILFLFIIIVLSGSCASTNKYKKETEVLRSEKQLRSDIDYAHKKLQKYHPDLYWYISKKELDFKFDSLKSSINAPMTSSDFYFELSPVIASIKQGHTRLIPLKNEEYNTLNTKEVSALYRFKFEMFDNKLYIVKDHESDKGVKPGTEVISINNTSPQESFSKWSKTFTSDGFNLTFKNRMFSNHFADFFHILYGEIDSAIYQLKYNDTINTLHIKNKSIEVQVEKEDTVMKKDSLKATYSRELSFPEPDSSIALLKMTNFNEHYNVFYKKSFNKLNSLKTTALILDLRDNTGGRLRAAYNLYSYLVDSNFYFTDKFEVASRTSLFHTNYFKNFRKATLTGKIFTLAFYPFNLVTAGVRFFKIEKGPGNKYYYSSFSSKPGHPKSNNFKGKVYVLINGGTYSASCILSSNLKGSDRAVFVGEETGGAYNGAVAGRMPVFKLPKSKLSLRFGLYLIRPHYKSVTEGHGIIPDIEIKPAVQDRINGTDPELKWVLDEIKGLHTSSDKK